MEIIYSGDPVIHKIARTPIISKKAALAKKQADLINAQNDINKNNQDEFNQNTQDELNQLKDQNELNQLNNLNVSSHPNNQNKLNYQNNQNEHHQPI